MPEYDDETAQSADELSSVATADTEVVVLVLRFRLVCGNGGLDRLVGVRGRYRREFVGGLRGLVVVLRHARSLPKNFLR